MKPLIGITAEINPATNMCEVNHEYALAVAAAGGTPVMLAPLSDSPSYVETCSPRLTGFFFQEAATFLLVHTEKRSGIRRFLASTSRGTISSFSLLDI